MLFLGNIESLDIFLSLPRSNPHNAWDSSCTAVTLFSLSLNLLVWLFNPVVIFSYASLKFFIVISSWSPRTAYIAASFIRLNNSAPLIPLDILAISSKSTSSFNGLGSAYNFINSLLPSISNTGTSIFLDKRPALKTASSSISGLLVAHIVITSSVVFIPSNSTNIWFNVWAASFPLFSSDERLPITHSHSSINITDGAFFLALSYNSLTLEAPTPTYLFIKFEPHS